MHTPLFFLLFVYLFVASTHEKEAICSWKQRASSMRWTFYFFALSTCCECSLILIYAPVAFKTSSWPLLRPWSCGPSSHMMTTLTPSIGQSTRSDCSEDCERTTSRNGPMALLARCTKETYATTPPHHIDLAPRALFFFAFLGCTMVMETMHPTPLLNIVS